MSTKFSVFMVIAVIRGHDDLLINNLDYTLQITAGRGYGTAQFDYQSDGELCVIQNFDDDFTCGSAVENGALIDFPSTGDNSIYRGFFAQIC